MSHWMISENEQELFDHVVVKLCEQGKASVGPQGTCQYTDPQGNHCAAGWMLTPAGLKVASDLESEGGSVAISYFETTICKDLSERKLNFLQRMQRVHDNAPSRERWRSMMREVAKDYGLSAKVLEERLTDAWTQAGTWAWGEEDV